MDQDWEVTAKDGTLLWKGAFKKGRRVGQWWWKDAGCEFDGRFDGSGRRTGPWRACSPASHLRRFAYEGSYRDHRGDGDASDVREGDWVVKEDEKKIGEVRYQNRKLVAFTSFCEGEGTTANDDRSADTSIEEVQGKFVRTLVLSDNQGQQLQVTFGRLVDPGADAGPDAQMFKVETLHYWPRPKDDPSLKKLARDKDAVDIALALCPQYEFEPTWLPE